MNNVFKSNWFGGGYWADNVFAGPEVSSHTHSTSGIFIQDLMHRRGRAPSRGHTHNFIELRGGRMVFMSFYEPDANTCRELFYYNTRENKLFKKMRAGNQFVWKEISEPPGDRPYFRPIGPFTSATILEGYGYNYGADYGGGL